MYSHNLAEAATMGLAPRISASDRLRRSVVPFVGPLLLLIVLGFDLPVLLILGYSFSTPSGIGIANYESLIHTSLFAKVVANTLRITVITTLVVAVLGYAVAYWISGLSARKRNLALIMVVLPFWVSVLVRTYAWIVILGNGGIVNRFLQSMEITDSPVGFLYNSMGVIIGMANVQMPLLILPLYAAMIRIDKRHMAAAASLGASNRVIFWRVFFPQTIPALASGVLLVLILCLGFYITPAILGGGRVPMVANMLDIYINQIPRWETASAISAVLLVLTLALFGLYRRMGAKMESDL
jgi:ABC-type spermidine/putrescine transport system permease subunit I